MSVFSFRRSFVAAPLIASVVLAATAVVAVWLAASSAAYAQITEDFNTTPNHGNPATFGNDTGGFSVSNPTGVAGVYQSDRSQLVNISTLIAPGFTHLSEATLTFDLLGANDSGAVLRSDAEGANALALIVRPITGDLYFIQRSGSSFVGPMLANASLAGLVSPGDNLRVTFSSAGDTFTASVAALSSPSTVLQSTSYTAAPNSVAAAGRAGLYQYGNASFASQFDNVGLTAAATTAPEPGTLSLLGMGLVSGAGIFSRGRKVSIAQRRRKPA